MRLFREKYVPKHATAGNTLTDCTFMRRIVVLVMSVLLCVAAMGVTAYALFYHGVTTTANQITTADYALSFSLDSAEAETVYMSSAGKTYVFDEAGTHSLAISTVSEENLAPTGFCIITRNDTDENDDSRTTNFYTTQLGTGGSNSLTLTLEVLSAGSVTVKPHWGTYSNYGYISGYTAVNNSQIDIGTAAVNYNTFTHSDNFANVDAYLYRVGNGNTVALGSLFKSNGDGDNAVNAANVKITVEAVESEASVYGSGSNLQSGSNGKCTYTINASDWTESTLKFTGEGPVRVTIQEGETGDAYTLNLEVVNGYNVTAYSGLQNRNSVLLNDITMTSGGKYYLSNSSLYGNGFTFDVTAGAYGDSQNGGDSNNYVVGLLSAKLDNVKIIGKVYTDYGGTRYADYNFPCVLVNGGECEITNCYISNCASPVRARGGANLFLINTTLKGGSFCNLDLRSGVNVTADGLTTINQVASNDAADNGTVIVGLGILFYYEGMTGNETFTITGNGLTQYNYVNENQKDNAVSSAKSAFSSMFNINSKFIRTVNNVKWVNTGILSLTSSVGIGNIDTPNGYDSQSVSMLSQSGYLFTLLASSYPSDPPISAPAYSGEDQYAIAPVYSFEYPTASGKKNYLAKTDGSNDYCYWDSSTSAILVGFDEGDSFSFDPDILNVTKYGMQLTPTVSLDGGEYQNVSSNIALSAGGSHTLTFRYTDPYNYDKDGQKVYSKTYTKTVKITAIAAIRNVDPATFAFGSNGYKSVTANNTTYVMPDVSATAENSIGSKTVGGQTIYYPIIMTKYATSANGTPNITTSTSTNLTKSSTTQVYCPIFDGVVTITDYDENNNPVTYGSSTTTMADGKLSFVESGVNTGLKWSSADTPSTTPVVKQYKLYFQSVAIQGVTRSQTTPVFEYIYTDTAGNAYHYFVGYYFPKKQDTSSCLASGTLITLADGTQKTVEQLDGSEELLVWNLETGKYDHAPVVFIDSDPAQDYQILHTCFSDGTDVEVVYEHGFFDLTLGRYVYINESTMNDYIGHEFITLGNVLGNTLNSAILTHVWTENKTVSVYSPVTFGHLCYYTDGVLSMPGGIEGLFNIFEVDTETMAYDPAKKQADIKAYGLLTTDDYAGMITEYMFNAFNGQYLAVAVGKGQLTWDYIAYLAERYAPLCE